MPFSKTKSCNLSGGNKRKLVCAMSLIGCPSIEFLDEPTTGVDPVSRRSLFNMLKKLEDSALILTTHRMDEAESLCDNIAIMINGRFVCYGSSGYLKSTYGKGYSIIVKHIYGVEYIDKFVNTKMNYLDKVQTLMTSEKDTNSYPIYETSYEIRKTIPHDSIGLYMIFDALCELRFKQNLVIDFSVSRGSLEQVFIQFAKHHI